MMALRWVLFLTLCAGLHAQASAQVFNRRYHPHGANSLSSVAWSVQPTDSGRYLIALGADYLIGNLYTSSVVTSLVVDSVGTQLAVDRVVTPGYATYAGGGNGMDKCSDGRFVVGGSNFTTDSLDNWIQRPVLYFINGDGSMDGFIELGPENHEWIGRQAKQTPDGGYVICGDGYIDNAGKGFLIKTNAEGEQEWVHTYGDSTHWKNVINFSIIPQGGYYISGEKRTTSNNRDPWVARVDSVGNVIWEQVFGTPMDDSNAFITTTADGNCVFGSYRAEISPVQVRSGLTKLDVDGNLLWDHRYGPISYSGYEVIHEIHPGGDLIASGYWVTGTPSGSQYDGILLRTTSAGDSLWLRHYQYHDDVAGTGRGFFRDVSITPDGGFIACGTTLPIAIGDTTYYQQDTWVVKTDSMGCIEPGCNLITGMDAQITNMRDALHVYPNPVVRGAVLQVEIKLPSNFTAQGPLRLTVTDALGRLVLEDQLAPGTRSANLPITGALAVPGVYHLHLSDASRWISGATFVVE